MHTRRSLLAAGAAATAATAGCVDFLLGEDLSFEATAASVAVAALEATGYSERRVTDQSADQTFEAAGESRTVGITNWRAEYEKSVDLSGIGGSGLVPAATFTVVTSPKAEILDQTFNPLRELSTADLASMAQARYQGFGTLEEAGETTATLLGSETTVTRFEARAGLTDTDIDPPIDLHVSEPVTSGSDFALVVAGHPQAIAGRERENVFRLMEGVRHDG